jgi:hypothetical protein
MYLVYSAFTSRPISLLASVGASVFFFMVAVLSFNRFISSAGDVSHLISVPPDFHGPS